MKSNIGLFYIIGALVFASKVRGQDTRGTPGVDYPNYYTIPQTSFRCSEQKYNPGFYADLETKCQAFHFCFQDRQESFLCPTGTIFNQALLTCDIWYNSNCSFAPTLFNVNVGPAMERAGKNLPMLLRLRNRSQSRPTTTTMSSVFDKVSSLYETSRTKPSQTLEASRVSAVEESDSNVENRSPIDASPEDFDRENDQMISDSAEVELDDEIQNDASVLSYDVNGDESAFEVHGDSIVYDPVTDYYMNYGQYETEWKDSVPSKDFAGSYSYQNPAIEQDATGSLLNDYVDENDSELVAEYLEPDNPTDLDSESFFRRNTRTDLSSMRVRRKPVYVVLDDESESNPSNEQSTKHASDSELSDVVAAEEDESILSAETRESRQMNETLENSEVTPSPEPFPRPTRIPPHQLELSTETPMTSDEFGEAIFSELVEPYLPDDYGTLLASTYPQPENQGTPVQSETDREVSGIQSDQAAFVENPMAQENYRSYLPKYGYKDESGAEMYESPDQTASEDGIEDTFVVIPDEDDLLSDKANIAETSMQMDSPSVTRYAYDPRLPYPGFYSYPNIPSMSYFPSGAIPQWPGAPYQGMKSNFIPGFMANGQRYEGAYQQTRQPMNYASSNYENSYMYADFPYTDPNAAWVEYNSKNDAVVTDVPLKIPVTEADLNLVSLEQDFIQDAASENGEPENVYYVLDFDEQTEGDKSELNKGAISNSRDSIHVSDSMDYLNDKIANESDSVASNTSLDTEKNFSKESGKSDSDEWPSLSTSEKSPETIRSASSIHAASAATESSEELDNPVTLSSAFERLASMKAPYSSDMGNPASSKDPNFLSNMGFPESMDFGPYGYGANMGQQFSMLDSMQPGQTGAAYTQRVGESDQSKVSKLSAIQEKMRTMKQGKFGAFKKYMSSSRNP